MLIETNAYSSKISSLGRQSPSPNLGERLFSILLSQRCSFCGRCRLSTITRQERALPHSRQWTTIPNVLTFLIYSARSYPQIIDRLGAPGSLSPTFHSDFLRLVAQKMHRASESLSREPNPEDLSHHWAFGAGGRKSTAESQRVAAFLGRLLCLGEYTT